MDRWRLALLGVIVFHPASQQMMFFDPEQCLWRCQLHCSEYFGLNRFPAGADIALCVWGP
jgi:hypothetical protein